MVIENENAVSCYINHQENKNLNCPEHVHLNYELLIVYEGELSVTLNGNAHSLSAQEAILILPGQPHMVESIVPSRSYMCVFSSDNVNEFEFYAKDCELINPVFTLSNTEFIDVFKAEQCNRFIQKSFLYFICGLAAREGLRKNEPSEESRLVFKILNYIKQNHLKNITLKDMAAAFEYNYTYMSNCFNRIFKTGFSSTVNGYRINHAKKLLSTTKLSIAEVSNECGFATVRNFNRTFLDIESVTPKIYRRQNSPDAAEYNYEDKCK